MAQPTIMVQALDANNDPIEGPNGPLFLTDIDAVAQIITQALRLLLGEWWENLDLGYPLLQNIIGASGSQAGQESTQVITQNTILSCPYVTQILSFNYTFTSTSRASAFTCQVATAFGNLTVTNAPGLSAVLVAN